MCNFLPTFDLQHEIRTEGRSSKTSKASTLPYAGCKRRPQEISGEKLEAKGLTYWPKDSFTMIIHLGSRDPRILSGHECIFGSGRDGIGLIT